MSSWRVNHVLTLAVQIRNAGDRWHWLVSLETASRWAKMRLGDAQELNIPTTECRRHSKNGVVAWAWILDLIRGEIESELESVRENDHLTGHPQILCVPRIQMLISIPCEGAY